MTFPQNLHTHTVFGDGKHTPEEMVQGAIRAGCRSLGFSEHSPMPPEADPDGWTMNAAREAEYRREVLRLREAYRDRLEIFLGLELDADSPAPAEPYDYIIGSAHGVWKDGCYLSSDASPESFARGVEEHFGGDYIAFAAACFRREAEFAAASRCQIVGHFDLVTKFNQKGRYFDEEDPRYRRAALEALEAAMAEEAIFEINGNRRIIKIKDTDITVNAHNAVLYAEEDNPMEIGANIPGNIIKIMVKEGETVEEKQPIAVIFEINTGAISRRWRTAPYPAAFLLDAIRQREGRICITSDSHDAGTITCAFSQAAALAESRGFREAWVLGRDGFYPVPLSEWGK